MSNWGNVQEGMKTGYLLGRETGGKLSGLGMALNKIATNLKTTNDESRALGQKQNLLGYEGLIKGTIAPAQEGEQGVFSVPGVGKVRQIIETKEWKPRTQEEALGFEQAKAGLKTSSLSPSVRKLKIKDTSDLINLLSKNQFTKQYTQEALDAADKIPQGALGKVNRLRMEWFDPKNPVLAEWQKVKSVLSDIQLGKLQFTKGAISDKEMEFFGKAVANDDIASAPKIKLILNRALNELSADEEAKKSAYIRNYGEDPDESIGSTSDMLTIQDVTGKTIQISRQEAIRKGYING